MGWQEKQIPSVIGEYRVQRRIGAGGMGIVYLAVSPSGRLVALKVIRGELVDDAGSRARFRLEVDAARQVSGAFTASVLGADPDGEPPWMATQFFDAPTLASRVRDGGGLEMDAVRQLGRGLAEALRDIHRVGLAHRDLKPGNVLLTDDGPRVIDFGIARALKAEPLTRTGEVLGTVSFMAPEQLNTPRDVGTAADVFAMGGVLTYAVTGRGPFDGDAGTPPIGVAMKIVHEAPDLADLPAALRSVVEKCLLKDPSSRPTPTELLTLLPEEARTADGPPEPESSTGAPTLRLRTPRPATPPPADPPAAPKPRPGTPSRRRRSVYALVAAATALSGVVAWVLLPGGDTSDDTASGPTASSPYSRTPAAEGSQGSSQNLCDKKITRSGPQSGHAKRINIGVTGGRPGMALRKPSGGYTGLDADVATYVARQLGYAPTDIVWADVPICQHVSALQDGEVSLLVSSFTPNESRSTRVDFSNPYLTGHQDVLLPAGSPDVRKATDLKGKKVCSVSGTTAAENFRRDFGPKVSPVNQATVEDCVNAMDKGMVDAVTSDDTALAYAATLEASAVKLAGLRLTDTPYAIGLPKASPLRDKVNAALHQMAMDGAMDRAISNNLPLLTP